MDTTEQNVLIAKFMGAEVRGECLQFTVHPRNQVTIVDDWAYATSDPSRLEYNSSWSWLMPVVEKISKIRCEQDNEDNDTYYPRTFGMISGEGEAMFRYNRHTLFMNESLIVAAFEATVDFIQSVNLQTTPPPQPHDKDSISRTDK